MFSRTVVNNSQVSWPLWHLSTRRTNKLWSSSARMLSHRNVSITWIRWSSQTILTIQIVRPVRQTTRMLMQGTSIRYHIRRVLYHCDSVHWWLTDRNSPNTSTERKLQLKYGAEKKNVKNVTYFTVGTDLRSSGALGPNRIFCTDIWVVLYES